MNMTQAMDAVGMGSFQRRTLVICCLCFMSDALEVLLVSFLQVLVRSSNKLVYHYEKNWFLPVYLIFCFEFFKVELAKDWAINKDQKANIATSIFVGKFIPIFTFYR